MSEKVYFKTIAESIQDVLEEGTLPFIWAGIKQGSFGYVFGPSKSGKTTFCENLAFSLICGEKEFLGQPLVSPQRVLFISLEEYKRQRTERNIKQIESKGITSEMLQNYLVVEDEFPRFIRTPEEETKLRDLIIDSKAEIIFIDSQTRIGCGDMERSESARIITARLKEICYDCNVTMIIIHHTPKLNGRPIMLDSLAGSHVFAQEADFIIGINRIKDVRYMKEVAYRYKRENDESVLTFKINDHLIIEPTESIKEERLFIQKDMRTDDSNFKSLWNLIDKHTTTTNNAIFKTGEIEVTAINEMSRGTYYDKLKELSDKGVIIPVKKGEYLYNHKS